jgi:hypothetical protein
MTDKHEAFADWLVLRWAEETLKKPRYSIISVEFEHHESRAWSTITFDDSYNTLIAITADDKIIEMNGYDLPDIIKGMSKLAERVGHDRAKDSPL